MTFRTQHLLAALVLHAALFAMLASGVRCSRRLEAPSVMEAVLLEPSRQQIAEQKRRAMEEQKRREQEVRDAAEKEKRRLLSEAEARRKAELEARKKTEQEQKKKQAEAKKALERAVQQEALQLQLEQEQRARAKAQQDKERAQWQSRLVAKVRQNWTRPPGSAEKFECRVQVQQLPGGQVIQARILDPCGDPALHESVVNAVLRSDPLPTVSDPSLFLREFTFKFIP
ncbi:MAG: cell envelope integrity protein TolA [Nevskiales bacterium]|nr:cell envelope integrity protein TolA [Nevskiales bacterium]